MIISAILLAAGESERMGQPKQMMRLGESTILEQAIDNLVNSVVTETIVVLGYRAGDVKKTIANKEVRIAINPDYRQGMSTSIISGLKMIDSKSQAVMIALGDQPFIYSQTINSLMEAFISNDKGIVIPVFQGRRGHPVIFDMKYKDNLLKLKGDTGGREITSLNPEDVLELDTDCEGVCIDIDTMENYTLKIANSENKILGGQTR